MKRISSFELKEYLDEIISCDAFELHKSETHDGKQNFYIPYMMNDALECYLVLEDGTMTGTYREDLDAEMSVDHVNADHGLALIFRQGMENIFTIWYESCYCEQKCYRYDQIGHFWVEGEEHWRRLVYIIGTIHDKYRYMGEMVCNEKEMELMPLMEFAPFRYFSPIHEALDEYYDESEEGFLCMQNLAKEAGDKDFLRMMKLYELTPFKRQGVAALVNAMMSPKRNTLYEVIFEKVRQASLEYSERVYPAELSEEIQKKRTQVDEILRAHGFSGSYPYFYKGTMQILAMEEHPFTILESEHYGFRIQYMVSECSAPDKYIKRAGQPGVKLNAGFFKKKGNRGWIARNLEFLDVKN